MILFVAMWAFAEATVFFVVADMPISAVALARGPRPALIAALAAAFAAAAGGVALARISAADPRAMREVLAAIPGIGPALIDRASRDWAGGGWRAMLAGSFSGVPYKLYAHAAGLHGASALGLFAMSFAARLPRFLIAAAISSGLRKVLAPRFSPRTLAALFVLFWSAFYTVYFACVGP